MALLARRTIGQEAHRVDGLSRPSCANHHGPTLKVGRLVAVEDGERRLGDRRRISESPGTLVTSGQTSDLRFHDFHPPTPKQ